MKFINANSLLYFEWLKYDKLIKRVLETLPNSSKEVIKTDLRALKFYVKRRIEMKNAINILKRHWWEVPESLGD
jgi:hypothetical protein